VDGKLSGFLMTMAVTVDTVRQALLQPNFDSAAAQSRMMPGNRNLFPPAGTTPRQAGVLLLLYPEADGLHVVFTRRTAALRSHSGQISFPGGRRDAADDSFTATALRETHEELGIDSGLVSVLGMLSCLYIPPSNYEVYPSVGFCDVRPAFLPSPDEVAEVFSVPLSRLFDPQVKTQEDMDFKGTLVTIPYYALHGHKVWGATAIILSELEGRLHCVLNNRYDDSIG
jgi:8-oxo-dGTP pyrophosphatase MutT (NUDIX family)